LGLLNSDASFDCAYFSVFFKAFEPPMVFFDVNTFSFVSFAFYQSCILALLVLPWWSQVSRSPVHDLAMRFKDKTVTVVQWGVRWPSFATCRRKESPKREPAEGELALVKISPSTWQVNWEVIEFQRPTCHCAIVRKRKATMNKLALAEADPTLTKQFVGQPHHFKLHCLQGFLLTFVLSTCLFTFVPQLDIWASNSFYQEGSHFPANELWFVKTIYDLTPWFGRAMLLTAMVVSLIAIFVPSKNLKTPLATCVRNDCCACIWTWLVGTCFIKGWYGSSQTS
jgi:hypothetical protein